MEITQLDLLTQFLDKWHELLVLAQWKDGTLEWSDHSRETEELDGLKRKIQTCYFITT
jgi:hypothetical protein